VTEVLRPRDHAEEVALFRAQLIGSLVNRSFAHGELRAELRKLAKGRYRAPNAPVAKKFGESTLERWYYRFKLGGLEALRPGARNDRGHGRALTDEARALLLDIRQEHPTASAELILRTLVTDGRLAADAVSPATVRRLFAENGLDRRTLSQNAADGGRVRRRWQAEHPGQLWHADVCHGPALRVDGKAVPLRIHAILDDASRYVVAIRACQTEREADMLALYADAVRSCGLPGTLYLDNGSTYSGEALATACGRLGVALVHARPYDPQARGKMERFWRTLRMGLLDHLREPRSLHEVQVFLLAWLERGYHRLPHGGLLGKTPAEIWATHTPVLPEHERLVLALTARGRRRVRKDGTIAVGGLDWESDAGFLAGRLVTIARSLCEPTAAPWIEHEERRIPLRLVDPVANGKKGREPFQPKPGIDAVAFDPARVQLDAWLDRRDEP